MDWSVQLLQQEADATAALVAADMTPGAGDDGVGVQNCETGGEYLIVHSDIMSNCVMDEMFFKMSTMKCIVAFKVTQHLLKFIDVSFIVMKKMPSVFMKQLTKVLTYRNF